MGINTTVNVCGMTQQHVNAAGSVIRIYFLLTYTKKKKKRLYTYRVCVVPSGGNWRVRSAGALVGPTGTELTSTAPEATQKDEKKSDKQPF